MALRTDGNQRYSMTKNKRSLFVSCARSLTVRCDDGSAAFLALSRLFDLNGKANRVRQKQISAIIAAEV